MKIQSGLGVLLVVVCMCAESVAAREVADYLLRGPYPILSVPYEQDGTVDGVVLVKEAEFVAGCGVNGFIWAQSNDAIDLLDIDEKRTSFEMLARAFSGRKTVVVLGCQGKDCAEMLALAQKVEELAEEYPDTSLAIACRPPHDARTQDDIGRYYRALAKVAHRPVIVQTYTSDKVPCPSTELLIGLAREFPRVFGWIKEETGGEDANERMACECSASGIKTVFSAWGSYGWLDQYRRFGTRGLVSERVAYADLLMSIWNALEGKDNVRADELFAKYLLMMNLKETIPGGHLRGFNLYVLKKRGIFRNYLSRDYVDKDKTPGKWKLVDRAFTEQEIAEIEDRYERIAPYLKK